MFEAASILNWRLNEAQTLAVIFHDLICWPHGDSNEINSAHAMMTMLDDASNPTDKSTLLDAYDIILSTKHHVPLCYSAGRVIDLDLYDLGTSKYHDNGPRLREEYTQGGTMSIDQYEAGRAKWLKAFLARPSIYVTGELHPDHEARARENLEHDLMMYNANHPKPLRKPRK